MLNAGGSVSKVVVVFGAGGALRLGEWADPTEAQAAAEIWAAALHREGRGGCVVITR